MRATDAAPRSFKLPREPAFMMRTGGAIYPARLIVSCRVAQGKADR
jgi:hypothetical protein